MCTLFLEQGEFCESCASALENESFVEKQVAQLSRPKAATNRTQKKRISSSSQNLDRKQEKLFIWVGSFGSSAMIFFALVVYAFPTLFVSAETLATEAEEQRLEDCRLVFEEITYVLRSGETPDSSMSCEGISVPNTIRRNGDIVRVDHPNPAMFGLSEIYVTNESHQVFLVGGEAGD